jgi:hypothetical protein
MNPGFTARNWIGVWNCHATCKTTGIFTPIYSMVRIDAPKDERSGVCSTLVVSRANSFLHSKAHTRLNGFNWPQSAAQAGSSAVSVVHHAAGKQKGEADERTSSSKARTVSGSTMLSIFMLMASLAIPSPVYQGLYDSWENAEKTLFAGQTERNVITTGLLASHRWYFVRYPSDIDMANPVQRIVCFLLSHFLSRPSVSPNQIEYYYCRACWWLYDILWF